MESSISGSTLADLLEAAMRRELTHSSDEKFLQYFLEYADQEEAIVQRLHATLSAELHDRKKRIEDAELLKDLQSIPRDRLEELCRTIDQDSDSALRLELERRNALHVRLDAYLDAGDKMLLDVQLECQLAPLRKTEPCLVLRLHAHTVWCCYWVLKMSGWFTNNDDPEACFLNIELRIADDILSTPCWQAEAGLPSRPELLRAQETLSDLLAKINTSRLRVNHMLLNDFTFKSPQVVAIHKVKLAEWHANIKSKAVEKLPDDFLTVELTLRYHKPSSYVQDALEEATRIICNRIYDALRDTEDIPGRFTADQAQLFIDIGRIFGEDDEFMREERLRVSTYALSVIPAIGRKYNKKRGRDTLYWTDSSVRRRIT